VKKTIETIAQIKKQNKASNNMSFNSIELEEIKRLFVETGLSIAQIVENNKRLEIFANQFAVRMNNHKKYDAGQIASVIKDFTSWDKRD
jgi:hypothetical protein